MRGLVIDSDAGIRRELRRLLTSANYHCLDYASAEELLSADVKPVPAFLITAIQLPGISGFSLVRSLRLRIERMPAIFMTAYDSAILRDEAKQFENSAYLAKPFEAATLFKAIASLESQVVRLANPISGSR